jgi:hypothetical protein
MKLPHNADYTMVGDERRDRVRSSLIRIASADFFEGTSPDLFRNELSESLRHVVDACQLNLLLAPAPSSTGSSSPSITRDDTAALGKCLSSIDWKGLRVHHDDHATRRRRRQSKKSSRNVPEITTITTTTISRTTTTTPLEEFLSSLQDPYHWPSAGVGSTIEALIQALITQRCLTQNATSNVYAMQKHTR